MTLACAPDDAGRRLDRILRKALPAAPLSAIHRMLRTGGVKVNGKKAAADYRVSAGDEITFVAKISHGEHGEHGGHGETERDVDVLFEDDDLLVVNKPAGVAVHGPDSDNLAARVASCLEGKIPPSLSFKPGPLHRIDKGASGIVVFSASLAGAQKFSALLRERKVKKTYLAVLEGILEKEEDWEDSLRRDAGRRKTFTSNGGNAKQALSKARPLKHLKKNQVELTLAEIEIETGRTHQIRAQAAAHGHPLWGDRKYGAKSSPPGGGFLLHAHKLQAGGLSIEAPLPKGWEGIG